MQHDLQINIPNQDQPGDNFHVQPRKIKRWLRQLPLVNIGEAALTYNQGLYLANRQHCAAKLRLEIVETMRPTATIILTNLRKQLVARSFPLPPKSHRILQLYQAILSELAIGYKIVVRDATKSEAMLSNKVITLSTHRALRYLGEQLLIVAQVYAPTPEGIWQDINQLFQFADKYALVNRSIKDNCYHTIAKSSILDVFKQISLLAMAKPLSLHQGEAERLAAFFERASTACIVADNAIPDFRGNIHYINTNLDAPPEYTVGTEVAMSSANRYFDLSVLIDNLMTMIQGNKPEQGETIVSLSTLSRDLARRLLNSLTTNPKRRFNRGQKSSKYYVAIGLADISRALKDDQSNLERETPKVILPPNPSLTLIPKKQPKDNSDTSLFNQDMNQLGTSYTWDMIAKGNVITDKVSKQNGLDNEQEKEPSIERWQAWDMINQSAGGCRLLWQEASESKARVGELLGLRNPCQKEYTCQLGVIRWMQYYGDRGLEIGLQMLAPNILLSSAKYKDGHRRQLFKSLNVFVLFGVRALNQPPSIVTPPNSFKEGDELIIKPFNQEIEVKLTKLCTRKSTFNQFHYVSVSTIDKNTSSDKNEPTDSLWSAF